MKKMVYWVVLILGILLSLIVVGELFSVLLHTAELLPQIFRRGNVIGALPVLLFGGILEFIFNVLTNPAGCLGMLLLIEAKVLRKKWGLGKSRTQ